ncbi:unnamed protein product [Peronospora belbahrii]|uniref:RING-type domain-containing protein n=1 Tax=Peronospora belbahrii TaxID=622444 RepID=A0AAU9KYM2_9STRA|nr:unnamed protein product [Peronospora belbahrii]CAH0517176.1 unnamed protein product [Peronospora belbahrii]
MGTRSKKEVALWRIAKNCNAVKLQQFLLSNESDDDIQDLLDLPHPVKGTTPLMIAASKKYGADTVRGLLDLGADLHVTDTGKHQNTALHYAAYNNRVVQLELLLEAGADVLALNGKGHTALDVARLRGRKEAAAALTSRLEMHSDWLYLRSKSMLGFWRRRWCVLLACNSKCTATELCIFRSPDKVRPEAVLWQDSLTTNCTALVGEKKNGFKLDTRVVYQKLRCRRYSRYKSSGRTHAQKANLQPREYVFACDTGSSRDAWMRALENQQRGTNATVSSTHTSSSHRSSARSRAATVDSPPLPSVGSPVELSRNFDTSAQADEPGLLVTFGPVQPTARASAPTLVEDGNDFVWRDVPASLSSRDQETLLQTTVITISSDPNEPEPLVRGRCIVCVENHRDSVCIPCGHVAGCYGCIRAVTQESSSCPVCRAHVDGVVRIRG